MALGELLTIGIPTYNRAQLLHRALRSVTGRGIRVIVSDNGSTDDTPQVMAAFPDVIYLRNPENLGYDANQIRLFEATRTPFLWLLGDDDQAADHWLEELDKVFEHHGDDLDFILLNAILQDETSSKRPTTYKLAEDLEITSLEHFYKTAGHNLTIGAVILNMRELDLDVARSFVGTAHAYSGAILHALAKQQHAQGHIKAVITAKTVAILQAGEYKDSVERFRAAVFGTTSFFTRLAQIEHLDTFANQDLRLHINSIRFLFYVSRLLELDSAVASRLNTFQTELRDNLDHQQALILKTLISSALLRRTLVSLVRTAKGVKALVQH